MKFKDCYKWTKGRKLKPSQKKELLNGYFCSAVEGTTLYDAGLDEYRRKNRSEKRDIKISLKKQFVNR